jgi:hypothetical protein
MDLQTARAGRRGDAATGSQNAACLAACGLLNATDDGTTQDASASREAISAARDLAFEGLIEAGGLAESYARSLAEAAWRGDRSTVEIHLRQLRACVMATIDIFKQFDAVAAKGGVA